VGVAVRVLIVDDVEMTRRAERRVLEEEPDIEVVAEGNDGLTAFLLAEQFTPDVIVMDVAMPLIDGLGATKMIKSAHPRIRVIIVTVLPEMPYRDYALTAGADSFVAKDKLGSELIPTLRQLTRTDS
jgi:DNA-binding NarL/FixJ family response regulator